MMFFYLTDEFKRQESILTQQLLADTVDFECDACRWEVVRSGGVVSVCPEHRDNPDTPVLNERL